MCAGSIFLVRRLLGPSTPTRVLSTSLSSSKRHLVSDWRTRTSAYSMTYAPSFGREVDLVMESAIRNRYFREELNATKVPIYGPAG